MNDIYNVRFKNQMESYQPTKKPQRFQRKPSNLYIEQPERSNSQLSLQRQLCASANTSNPKQSFGLKLQKNTISIKISETNPYLAEDLLSESLFSIEGTPIRPYLDNTKKLSSNQKSTQIKLEYSPDPIFQVVTKPSKLDDSDLLLDTSQQYNCPSKFQISTATSQNDPNQSRYSRLSQIHPICSRFTICEIHPGLKATLLTINNYIFKIQYQPIPKQKKNLFCNNTLVKRVKKYFTAKPMQIFYFYQKAVKNFSQSSLRLFLIQSGIKYFSDQIQALEKTIMGCLLQLQPQQILDAMVFDKLEEDELILNLSVEQKCDKIILGQSSFWLIFHGFMQTHQYFRRRSCLSIQQLESFIKALM